MIKIIEEMIPGFMILLGFLVGFLLARLRDILDLKISSKSLRKVKIPKKDIDDIVIKLFTDQRN